MNQPLLIPSLEALDLVVHWLRPDPDAARVAPEEPDGDDGGPLCFGDTPVDHVECPDCGACHCAACDDPCLDGETCEDPDCEGHCACGAPLEIDGEAWCCTAGCDTCAACGCTPGRACPGGCTWVQPRMCSRCAEHDGPRATVAARAAGVRFYDVQHVGCLLVVTAEAA